MTLPPDLTEAEQDLVDAVAQGRPFDCSSREQAANDPAHGASWGEGRTIRASVIRALCVGGEGIPKPDPRGVSIVGARIEGSLDLGSVTVTVPLCLAKCHFQERVNCRDARLRLLDLEGSFLGAGLDGTGCAFGQLLLRHGFVCRGVVRLVGAKVAGFLDCSGATLDNPSGDALFADYLTVEGPVYLRAWVDDLDQLRAPFVANGAVRLFSASIGSGLDCRGATLRKLTAEEGAEAIALNAEGASIDGPAMLSTWLTPAGEPLAPFRTAGQVRLFGAEIGGSLECLGATFEAAGGVALDAEGASVGGSVQLMPAIADDEVRCGFVAEGAVRLFRAQISHALECTGSFRNPGDLAIHAEAVSVKGPVLLRSLGTTDGKLLTTFTAEGTVSLFDAEIGGSLACDGATFEGANGMALLAEGASVRGHVLLRTCVVDDRYIFPFSATGQVRLSHARIGSGLDCSGGVFKAERASRAALSASGASIAGPVYLRSWSTNGDTLLFPFTAGGPVSLFGARIDGELDCRGASFAEFLDLESASIHALRDDRDSWPERGRLGLDGFTYQRLSGDSPASAGLRLEWLRRQDGYEANPLKRLAAALRRRLRRQQPPPFRTQPYEQLVRVLRAEGREKDARKVAIAKQSDLRRSGQLGIAGYLWNLLLGALVGHGYRPGRTLWIAIAVVALGVLVFASAEEGCAIGPTRTEQVDAPAGGGCWVLPDNYPRYDPIIYSIDVFLPIINLHQEEYWLPNGAPPRGWLADLSNALGIRAGSLYWSYMWLHIALGWVLTSFIVAALSGLIKKD